MLPLAAPLWAQEPPRPPLRLAEVRTVYLMPMSSGFDQYLANGLTRLGVFHVVTDPERADAVLTDRLGPAFELRLEELYPSPPQPVPPPPDVNGKEAEDAAKPESKQAGIEIRPDPTARLSTFGRGRGNVFLLDPRARQVLWSTFMNPRSSRSDDLNKAGAQVAERLQSALKKQGGGASH